MERIVKVQLPTGDAQSVQPGNATTPPPPPPPPTTTTTTPTAKAVTGLPAAAGHAGHSLDLDEVLETFGDVQELAIVDGVGDIGQHHPLLVGAAHVKVLGTKRQLNTNTRHWSYFLCAEYIQPTSKS